MTAREEIALLRRQLRESRENAAKERLALRADVKTATDAAREAEKDSAMLRRELDAAVKVNREVVARLEDENTRLEKALALALVGKVAGATWRPVPDPVAAENTRLRQLLFIGLHLTEDTRNHRDGSTRLAHAPDVAFPPELFTDPAADCLGAWQSHVGAALRTSDSTANCQLPTVRSGALVLPE